MFIVIMSTSMQITAYLDEIPMHKVIYSLIEKGKILINDHF